VPGAKIRGIMVLSKDELISSLKNEVRIVLHLAGKIDKAKLDYRPTTRQRSPRREQNSLSYLRG
jgi:hypothetical protein